MTTLRGISPLGGSDVDYAVDRLVQRYGLEASKDALSRHANRKPGTKFRNDWHILEGILNSDARVWLEGGNPFDERSDYSIAKWFAENHPDQNVEFDSTMRRIKRRLSKDRRYHVLVGAFWLSEPYCYRTQIRLLRELSGLPKNGALWRNALKRAEDTLSGYRTHFGAPPANKTMRELEVAAEEARAAELTARNKNILADLRGARP